jgi:hypothetical protein
VDGLDRSGVVVWGGRLAWAKPGFYRGGNNVADDASHVRVAGRDLVSAGTLVRDFRGMGQLPYRLSFPLNNPRLLGILGSGFMPREDAGKGNHGG